jgi:hypothetical protein
VLNYIGSVSKARSSNPFNNIIKMKRILDIVLLASLATLYTLSPEVHATVLNSPPKLREPIDPHAKRN